jgi:hypothetical protein
MKRTFIFATVWTLLVCTQTIIAQVRYVKPSNEFFYGHKFPYSAFVRWSDMYVVVEIFYIDKRPREYFVDTLYAKENSLYKGRIADINIKRKKYYLSFSEDGHATRKIRIEADESRHEALIKIKSDYKAYTDGRKDN